MAVAKGFNSVKVKGASDEFAGQFLVGKFGVKQLRSGCKVKFEMRL